MSSIVASFLSSFFQNAHADAPEEDKEAQSNVEEAQEETEEPEDVNPSIREECEQSGKCAALTKHFEHCQEKVMEGKGFKGEDCVEELMMHCVDECAAPKLFAKLK